MKILLSFLIMILQGCILLPAPEQQTALEPLPDKAAAQWQIDQEIKQDRISEGYIREDREKQLCSGAHIYLGSGRERQEIIWLFSPETKCEYVFKYNIKSTFKCRLSGNLPLYRPLRYKVVYWKLDKYSGNLQADNQGAVTMYFASNREINFHKEMFYSLSKDFSDIKQFSGSIELPPESCEGSGNP